MMDLQWFFLIAKLTVGRVQVVQTMCFPEEALGSLCSLGSSEIRMQDLFHGYRSLSKTDGHLWLRTNSLPFLSLPRRTEYLTARNGFCSLLTGSLGFCGSTTALNVFLLRQVARWKERVVLLKDQIFPAPNGGCKQGRCVCVCKQVRS